MIFINGNWEEVYDFYDISKIIRQQFNSDLADELDKLVPNHTDEEYYELQSELEERYGEISTLEDELSYKDGEIDRKDEEIEDLENRIKELKNENFELRRI